MKLYVLLSLIFIGTIWVISLIGKVVWNRWKGIQAQKKAVRRATNLAEEAIAAEGGRPDNPIIITSPSVVETRAARSACPFCEVEMNVESHRVMEHEGRRLRVAELKCLRCEFERKLYFSLRQFN